MKPAVDQARTIRPRDLCRPRLAQAALYSLLALFYASAQADTNTLLQVSTNRLSGVPGEPLALQLTLTSDRVQPMKLKVPSQPGLLLRQVSKVPIRMDSSGRYVQQRALLWQGLEPGQHSLTNLSVGLKESTYVFPTVQIIVKEVTAAVAPEAAPPAKDKEAP